MKLEREHAQVAHHQERQRNYQRQHYPLTHGVVAGIVVDKSYPEDGIGWNGKSSESSGLISINIEPRQTQGAKHRYHHRH